MTEHEILIYLDYNKRKLFKRGFKATKEAIQNKPYFFSITFKNIGHTAIPILKVSAIRFIQGTAEASFPYQIDVPPLNSGEAYTFVFPQPDTIPFKEGVWIKTLIPPPPDSLIKTYQYNKLTKSNSLTHQINRWEDFFFVTGKLEQTNFYLSIISTIVAILLLFDAVVSLFTL